MRHWLRPSDSIHVVFAGGGCVAADRRVVDRGCPNDGDAASDANTGVAAGAG
jgi:hypothetical protein